MNSGDDPIDAYYILKPAQYSVLESLSLTRSTDPVLTGRFDLLLRLAPPTNPVSKCLSILFAGVRELKIGTLDHMRVSHLLVDISSIRKDQLENLNYRIVENEENAFSFSCANFTAEICDR